jgi:hypothetical protein
MPAGIAPPPHQAVISTVVAIRADAVEIGRIGGITASFISSFRRVRAQRPGERCGLRWVLGRMHGVGLIGRCDQHIRGYALLDPALQSEHRIMFGIE